MLISQAYAQAARRAPGGDMLRACCLIILMFVRALLPDDPPADEAREGAQGDDRGAAEGRRSRHRRRLLGRISQDRRQLRDARDRADNVEIQVQRPRSQLVLPKGTHQEHLVTVIGATTECSAASARRSPLTVTAAHESLSRSGSTSHRRRARRRLPLHAAELLRRSAGGAGLAGQGDAQGRHRAARARRRSRSKRRTSRIDGVVRSTRPASRCASPTPTRSSRPRTCCRRKLGEDYVVALNLLSNSPALARRDRRAADVPGPRPARRRALPAAGRHEGGARQEAATRYADDIRSALREKRIQYAGIAREGQTSACASATRRRATRRCAEIERTMPDLELRDSRRRRRRVPPRRRR